MIERPSELDVWWTIAYATVGTSIKTLFRVRSSGVRNVPPTGGALLAFNHVSVIDALFVALPVVEQERIVRFLGLAEDFERPGIGWGIRTLRHIPVRRGAGDWSALQEIADVVADGWIGGIAPEGTVGDGAQLQRAHKGAARIALLAGVPVVPVGLWGPQRRWPREGLQLTRPIRPGVGISYGTPIPPEGDVKRRADVQALTDRIMAGIGTQVVEARRLASTVGR